MRKSPTKLLSLAACMGLLLTGGCVGETAYTAGGEVIVTGPPPAYVRENVTLAPAPGYVWIGGEWVWRNQRWNWERGHWAVPPHHGALWVPGHYYDHRGRHFYRPGHWW